MTEPIHHERRVWSALLLSLLCAGLGHIYCGRIVRGLGLFLASLLLLPAGILFAHLPPSGGALVGILLVLLALPALYLFAVTDSIRIARRSPPDYQPREYNRVVVYVLFAVVGALYPAGSTLLLRAHYVAAYKIPTQSMSPTLRGGDRILVNKIAFRLNPPERGDLVVFRYPADRERNYIKRVIGLPGDQVRVEGGGVWLNGEKLDHEAPPPDAPGLPVLSEGELIRYETLDGRRYAVALGPDRGSDFAEAQVPEGCYFVLGDGRSRSKDSRSFGYVPGRDLIGLAHYVFYPADSWSRFGTIR